MELPHLRRGTTVLADVLHTSRETGPRTVAPNPFWIFRVKANQPTLFETLLDHGLHGSELQDEDCGHGCIETRWLVCSGEIDRDVPQP